MNGLLNATYDRLEAGAGRPTPCIYHDRTYEEASRTENREDRVLVRARHAPDRATDRGEARFAEEWARPQCDHQVDALKEGLGWKKDGALSLPNADITGALDLAEPDPASGARELEPELGQ